MFFDIIERINLKHKEFQNALLQGSIDSYETFRYHRGVLTGLALALETIEEYQREMTRLNNDED